MNAVPQRHGKTRGDERDQAEKNGPKSRTLQGFPLRKAAGLYQQCGSFGTAPAALRDSLTLALRACYLARPDSESLG